MEVLYERCAGLDVHKKTVTVCRVRLVGRQREQEVQRFGTTTPELLSLADWLAAWSVTHVAMESTGEYWKPIYNILEGNYDLLLVNAQHLKHVPGRKTDVKDAEWLAECLRHGLLRASFVPERPQRALRDLTRYRTKLVQERSRLANRLQKVLEDANIKLGSVAADVLGKSGRAMLEAMIAGEEDGEVLSDMALRKLRSKRTQLEKALTGRMTDHHRFLLTQQLQHYDFLNGQIAVVEERVQQQMMDMDDQRPPTERDNPPEDTVDQDDSPSSEPLTHSEAIALLDTIPGVNERTAEVIIAEVGLDMERFPSHKHLAAWSGVAPGSNESAGKRYSGKTKPGNKALRAALSQAAWAAGRTKGTYLGTQYKRLAARRGKKRAIVAVGHSIIVCAYHILAKREPYRDLGAQYFDQYKKERTIKRLINRLNNLGVEVDISAPTVIPANGGI
jgi:transposase